MNPLIIAGNKTTGGLGTKTVLLMHFDGANGSTTFTDSA